MRQKKVQHRAGDERTQAHMEHNRLTDCAQDRGKLYGRTRTTVASRVRAESTEDPGHLCLREVGRLQQTPRASATDLSEQASHMMKY